MPLCQLKACKSMGPMGIIPGHRKNWMMLWRDSSFNYLFSNGLKNIERYQATGSWKMLS